MSPSWATLTELIAATGLSLDAGVRPGRLEPTVDRTTVSRLLELAPLTRLRAAEDGTPPEASTDPAAIPLEFAKRGVEFVLIGDAAARLYGAPKPPVTIDIAPRPADENQSRLREALAALDTQLHVDGIPGGVAQDLSRLSLAGAARWRFWTSAGRVDLHFKSALTGGYPGLAERAERFWLGDRPVAVASIADLIAAREATDCRADRDEIVVLRVLAALRV